MITSPSNGHTEGVTAQLTSAALAAPAKTPDAAEESPYTESDSRTAVYNFKPWKTRWVAALGLVFAITLIGAFAAASSPRIQHERDLAAAAEKEASAPLGAPSRRFAEAPPIRNASYPATPRRISLPQSMAAPTAI
jgi:hypothetical protein